MPPPKAGNQETHTSAPRAAAPAVYGLAVFLGAFLLFQVQPLVGKFIVPRFGGGPEVWTTCLLFYQTLLLGGYAYAHLIASRLSGRWQAVVHMAVLAAALVALPIVPAASTGFGEGRLPVLRVLWLLAASVGVPYFVLSASSPLLQSWFARTEQGRSPYRLYALSNAGSLLAVVSYPFLVEPHLGRMLQARAWSWGLGAYAVVGACLAVYLMRRSPGRAPQPITRRRGADEKPSVGRMLLWLALPAAASVELLAVTNKICQDITAVPLLWMLPLCVYLVSFVVCFHDERWYRRGLFLAVFALSIPAAILANRHYYDLPVRFQVAIYLVLLLACCLICHGELYRIRPAPRHLTRFYLLIAAGGAIGGFLVAVVAPLVLNSHLEFEFGLVACGLLVLVAEKAPPAIHRRRLMLGGAAAVVIVAAMVFSQWHPGEDNIVRTRNFFGVITVREKYGDDPTMHRYVLEHGTTIHGSQFVEPSRQKLATTYYGPGSGVGLAMRALAERGDVRVGVIGLGVGTLAAYGRDGDVIRFYEINPDIDHLAWSLFTYLDTTPATVDVVIGDARMSLEHQADQGFDMLVLDAFSSDSIPVHLLTAEAFETYLRHLAAGGVIAVHASAVYLDLQPVVLKLAEHFGLRAVCIETPGRDEDGTLSATWILLSRGDAILARPEIRQAANVTRPDTAHVRLWTDDYANPLQVLR